MSQASGVAKFSGEAIDQAKADFNAAADKAQGEQLALPGTDADDQLPDLSDNDGYHGLPDAGEIMAIMAGSPDMSVASAVTEYRRQKGAGGRKKGSTNKRSDDFARYMLQFGPHPGITMQRVQGRSVDQLAAELTCTKREAMQLQIRCASEMLPYFEGKKPVAIDITATGDFTLDIGDFMGAAIPAVEAGSDDLELGFADYEEVQQNQELGDDDQDGSE